MVEQKARGRIGMNACLPWLLGGVGTLCWFKRWERRIKCKEGLLSKDNHTLALLETFLSSWAFQMPECCHKMWNCWSFSRVSGF